MTNEDEGPTIPLRDRLVFLAAVVAHVRNGGTFEWGGPVYNTPRVVASYFQVRLGPEPVGPEIDFQMASRIEDRSGRTTTSHFTWCEWSIDDLAEIPHEMEGGSHTPVAPAERGRDPVVDQILALSRLGEAEVGRTWYAVDGARLSTVSRSGDYAPVDRGSHPAQEFMDMGLTPAQKSAILTAAAEAKRLRSPGV